METIHVDSDASAEFYLPGTFQFARSPGRIERFLGRHLRSRDQADVGTAGSGSYGFYLPGTPCAGAR